MMAPKKIALALLAAPALLVAVPAVAGADTGFSNCGNAASEQAGPDGAQLASQGNCVNSSTGASYGATPYVGGYGVRPYGYGYGYGVRSYGCNSGCGGGYGYRHHHRGLLGGLLGGIL